MTQHSTVIADGTGAQVLDAINKALETLKTVGAGETPPATPLQYQLWADTANGQLKLCTDAAGPTWVVLGSLGDGLGKLSLTGGALSGALNEAAGADIAAAATTDIGAATGNYVVVTGTAAVTSLGNVQAGARRIVKFAAAGLTLTYHATNLILPGAADIVTLAGDVAEFVSLGGGKWHCTSYQRPYLWEGMATNIASAATTNIGAANGGFVTVTGTTTITSLGTASAGTRRLVRFAGALTVTNNANIVLPAGQNITTVAGDFMEFVSAGGGVWYCIDYTPIGGSVTQAGGSMTGALNMAKGADIAAAATTNLASMTGNYATVTNASGAVTITSLGVAPAGAMREVTFKITAGSITVQHNATSLILPGGQNIGITDGDSAKFVSLGSGNWIMTNYQKNSLAARFWNVVPKTASYTVLVSDYASYFIYAASSAVTLTLPAAATAGAGFVFGIRNNNSNNAAITIDPNGSELIAGATTLGLGVGSAVAFICDGTQWLRLDSAITAVAGAGFSNAVEMLASGLFTVPVNVYQARITVWGAGGGGGGGGYSSGNTYMGGAGGNGGSTSFGSLISASGGAGGAGGAYYTTTNGVGGNGGTGSGGQINTTGGKGGSGGNTTYSNRTGGGGGGSAAGLSLVTYDGFNSAGYNGGNGAPNSASSPPTGVAGGVQGVTENGGACGASQVGSSGVESGAGGGGGAGYIIANGNGGGGGGAGGYAQGVFALTPGANHTCTVGIGGGGGGGGHYSSGQGRPGNEGGQGYGGGSYGGTSGTAPYFGGKALSTGAAGGGACAGGGGAIGTSSPYPQNNGKDRTMSALTNSGGQGVCGGGGAGAVPGGGGGGGGGGYNGSASVGAGGGGGGDGRILIEY